MKMNRRPFIVLGLLLCLPVFAAPQGDSGPPADILAIRNIEIIFHTAGSVLPSKDLDLMMSRTRRVSRPHERNLPGQSFLMALEPRIASLQRRHFDRQ
jgi:hypothetical protein